MTPNFEKIFRFFYSPKILTQPKYYLFLFEFFFKFFNFYLPYTMHYLFWFKVFFSKFPYFLLIDNSFLTLYHFFSFRCCLRFPYKNFWSYVVNPNDILLFCVISVITCTYYLSLIIFLFILYKDYYFCSLFILIFFLFWTFSRLEEWY